MIVSRAGFPGLTMPACPGTCQPVLARDRPGAGGQAIPALPVRIENWPLCFKEMACLIDADITVIKSCLPDSLGQMGTSDVASIRISRRAEARRYTFLRATRTNLSTSFTCP